MAQDSAPKWFIETANGRNGPFSTDQIHEQIQSGRLKLQARITADHLNNRWITVEELLSGPKAPFQPPPRPPELDRNTGPGEFEPSLTKKPAAVDPAFSLFDSLQAVRERKNKPGRNEQDDSISETRDHVLPPWLWVAAGAVILLTISAFGLQWFISNKKAPPPDQPSVANRIRTLPKTEPTAPRPPQTPIAPHGVVTKPVQSIQQPKMPEPIIRPAAPRLAPPPPPVPPAPPPVEQELRHEDPVEFSRPEGEGDIDADPFGESEPPPPPPPPPAPTSVE